jgi:formylglycine-generating enzyme required for sulfatase activity
MHGNVWEWCEDGDGPYPADPTGACPLHKYNEMRRVLRGGSWFNVPGYLRSAQRFGFAPESRLYVVGFRVARTPGSLAGLTF